MQEYATHYKTTFGGYVPAPKRPKDTITAEEIADLLNMKLDTFRKSRDRLMRLSGMPRPVPGMSLLWSRPNVMAWIHAQQQPVVARPGTAADPVEAAREALEARMAGRDA